MKSLILFQLIFFNFNLFAQAQDSNSVAPVIFAAEEIGTALNSLDAKAQNWRLSVAPTFWIPAVEGSFSGGGMVLEFEGSERDRLGQLSSGGELFLELTNGKWTFVFQTQYADVDFDGTLKTPYGALPAELRAESISIDFLGARRWAGEHAWVEVLIGGRAVEMKVKVKTLMGKENKSVDWYDPIVGIRGQYQIAEQWGVEGMVTASGFNFSDASSEHGYDSRLGINFTPNKNWQFTVGYRTSDLTNKENESKGSPENVKMTIKGPYVSVLYKFK